MTGIPLTINRGAFEIEVCIPKGWTDDRVKAFADKDSPCRRFNGWRFRHGVAGDRAPCPQHAGHVHVMLDA